MSTAEERFQRALKKLDRALDAAEAELEWVFLRPGEEDRAAWATLGIRSHVEHLRFLFTNAALDGLAVGQGDYPVEDL